MFLFFSMVNGCLWSTVVFVPLPKQFSLTSGLVVVKSARLAESAEDIPAVEEWEGLPASAHSVRR